MAKICEWKQDEWFDYYETSCGNSFTITDGTPEENNMKYCPYCGREIKEIKERNNNG